MGTPRMMPCQAPARRGERVGCSEKTRLLGPLQLGEPTADFRVVAGDLLAVVPLVGLEQHPALTLDVAGRSWHYAQPPTKIRLLPLVVGPVGDAEGFIGE